MVNDANDQPLAPASWKSSEKIPVIAVRILKDSDCTVRLFTGRPNESDHRGDHARVITPDRRFTGKGRRAHPFDCPAASIVQDAFVAEPRPHG